MRKRSGGSRSFFEWDSYSLKLVVSQGNSLARATTLRMTKAGYLSASDIAGAVRFCHSAKFAKISCIWKISHTFHTFFLFKYCFFGL